jgi:hypothetical protein
VPGLFFLHLFSAVQADFVAVLHSLLSLLYSGWRISAKLAALLSEPPAVIPTDALLRAP